MSDFTTTVDGRVRLNHKKLIYLTNMPNSVLVNSCVCKYVLLLFTSWFTLCKLFKCKEQIDNKLLPCQKDDANLGFEHGSALSYLIVQTRALIPTPNPLLYLLCSIYKTSRRIKSHIDGQTDR